MADKKNIVKYKRPHNLNIGVIFFGIIFIYIIFNVITYLTTEHISLHEVQQGTIAENNIYKGLILREETLFNSEYDGYINYYVHDTAKSSYNNLIYSVDENGDVAKKIEAAEASDLTLSSDDYTTLTNTIASFSGSYHSQKYYNVYTFKDELDAQIMEAVNKSALDYLSEYIDTAQANKTFHLINASEPGIVIYYTDDYEAVTTESFQPDMLNELNYKKTNLKQNTQIKKGETAYKMITGEDWSIILSVSAAAYEKLAESDVVQIQFKKDGTSCWVNYEFKTIGENHYMIISLKNHMVRFANDRFIEIALMIDEETGLKIPNSAITYKEFYAVPKEYFMKGGNSNSYGLLVEQEDKDGKKATVFVETTIYKETDDGYCIDEEEIISGSIIIKPESTNTYTIKQTEKVEGVYNVNKGYAVFKQIDVIYRNEEYSIIRSGTDYGISLYDHIALEGDKVQENDLVY